MPFAEPLRRSLLEVARRSIESGLETGQPRLPDLNGVDPVLRANGACFVTLDIDGGLRGCIGHLEADRALALDVAGNAYAAAFKDPRFPPLAPEEWPRVHLELSILGEPEPMQFDSEADLAAQLRVGVDGLILREGARRGTFLPSVWSQLPNPYEFLRHLKHKAGLSPDYWSDGIEVARYTTEHFGGNAVES